MSYSTPLGSTVSHTHLRTPDNKCHDSGMCSTCTTACMGTCEIGLSALRGSEAIYPYATDSSQFASEKNYPIDYSHFNINGRVFGARGCPEDSDLAAFPNVSLTTVFGKRESVPVTAPIILPALAKLNWRDYFAGSALFGVPAVIGEDVVAKDKGLVMASGSVSESPLLKEMVDAYRDHAHGYGDIIVQANEDDERLGVLEYAIRKLGVTSVELKFGQAAKGIQGLGRIKTLEEAQYIRGLGYLVYPDPMDPIVIADHKKGLGRTFEKVGRLPMWTERHLIERVHALRDMGAKRICFKTGPFDPRDLVRILDIASQAGVDLVTFDGAGGGTGNSPVRMMNEWGIPTVRLQCMVSRIVERMVASGKDVPQIAITGGITMEDHVFKALALGSGTIGFAGICRGAMAAAMAGKQMGEAFDQGLVPKTLQPYGQTKEIAFENHKLLAQTYGDRMSEFTAGAIGVYSYLERVTTGLKQLMALNRKFDLSCLERTDVVPLTESAEEMTGLPGMDRRLGDLLDEIY